MDPQSRRQVWSLLQSKREGRVIFLTTHFMDEADILADYKIILSKGKIRCAGSSLFLKSRFGIGYHLGMVLEQDTNPAKISGLVTSHVPGAEVSRQYGKELSFRLPMSEVDKFANLFQAFETEAREDVMFSIPSMGVTSYGVAMTTLEEVFLKLEEKEAKDDEGKTNDSLEDDLGDTTVIMDSNTADDCVLHSDQFKNKARRADVSAWVHFKAFVTLRVILTLRIPAKIIFLMILPAIFMVVGMVFARQLTNKQATALDGVQLKSSLYLQQVGHGGDRPAAIWTNSSFMSDTDLQSLQSAFQYIRLQSEKITVNQLNNLLSASPPHVVAYGVDSVSKPGAFQLHYNDTQVHSLGVGINTMSNLLFKIAADKAGITSSSRVPITTYNKPFKATKSKWEYDNTAQMAVFFICMTFSNVVGSFGIEPIQNRQIGARHQLRLSGANRFVYWISFYLGDLVCYILPLLVFFILIPAFNITALKSTVALGCSVLLLLMYIPLSLSVVYVFSFAFKDWKSAQNIIGTIVSFIGFIPYFVVSGVDLGSGKLDSTIHTIINYIVCLIDPIYGVYGGFYYITRVFRVESILQQNNNPVINASKYFEFSGSNGLPITLIIIAIQLVFWTWLVFAIDCYTAGGVLLFPLSIFNSRKRNQSPKISPQRRRFSRRLSSRKSFHNEDNDNEDVKLERERVDQCLLGETQGEKAVVAKGLRKSFGKTRAVDSVNLIVERGEIFGILGPNGAGKTTTLNMITADLYPDRGQIYLGGYDISTNLDEAFKGMGYCPQFDALWDEVTTREHLNLYATIKGVSKEDLTPLIEHYASALKITEHLDKKTKELSGGTKRKLSFLMSMVGDADIIIMDEPSCGMDPSARRFLW